MWPRVGNVLVGVWLMAAPSVLGYGAIAATNDRIAGPTVAAIAIVAMSQVTRAFRWLNLLIGVWLLVAPWILDYPSSALASSTVSGMALAGLACLRGRVDRRYGGGWRSLVRPWRSPAEGAGP
jgi:hypothetical protein